MPTYKANGINIYAEDQGEGYPLVMIPGHGGDSTLWNLQIEYFKQYYRVIAIDNRGAGFSDKPETSYSMEMYSKDINELLNVMGVSEPVYLMGASMGGIIAQAFIHDYPERVKKLVLACSGVSAADPHYTPMDNETLTKLGNPGETPEEKALTLFEIFYHEDYLKQNPELFEKALNRKREPQPKHAYDAQLASCLDYRTYYEWLANINVPTLVVHSKEDIVWPIQNAYTLLEGIGKNARLHIIEKAGHILFREKPEEYNSVVHQFLEE